MCAEGALCACGKKLAWEGHHVGELPDVLIPLLDALLLRVLFEQQQEDNVVL